MGEDKGRLNWHGQPLVRYQWQRLEQLVPPASVIGGDYADLSLPSVADAHPGEGPLGAILTALAKSPAALILAVDMPLVTEATLAEMLLRPGGDAIVPRHPDGKLQPLAALYRASAQPRLAAAFANGARRVIDALGHLEICWWDTDPDEFRSMNTPTEYAEALEN